MVNILRVSRLQPELMPDTLHVSRLKPEVYAKCLTLVTADYNQKGMLGILHVKRLQPEAQARQLTR